MRKDFFEEEPFEPGIELWGGTALGRLGETSHAKTVLKFFSYGTEDSTFFVMWASNHNYFLKSI